MQRDVRVRALFRAHLSEGYTEVQGYLFGRPRPAEEVAPLLAAQPSNVLAVA